MPRPDETWMWDRAESLLNEADRLQRQFFQLGRPGAGRATWTPPVDIFETTKEMWILVALPGVRASDVEVVLEGAALVVHGQRTIPPGLRRAEMTRLEIPRGRFERRLELAAGSYEVLERTMVDGCLALHLRKPGARP